MDNFKVSVLVPCFNEEENVFLIAEKLKEQLSKYPDYEILFINDGSRDKTLDKLKELKQKESKVQYISFSRNFGKEKAVKAGFDYADGDCVIPIDADLQHPPEVIPQLIGKWQEGNDIVYTVKKNPKSMPLFVRFTSSLFYRFVNLFSDIEMKDGASDLILVDKTVVDVIRSMNEDSVFIRGIISWIGFNKAAVTYVPGLREKGETKYTFKKRLSFAVSGFILFSTKPLRLSFYLGLIISALSFVWGIVVMSRHLFGIAPFEGYATIVLGILFLGGIQLIILGIIGEYLGKVFMESKKRPIYIVRETSKKMPGASSH